MRALRTLKFPEFINDVTKNMMALKRLFKKLILITPVHC